MWVLVIITALSTGHTGAVTQLHGDQASCERTKAALLKRISPKMVVTVECKEKHLALRKEES